MIDPNSTEHPTSSPSGRPKVLVLGDWVIDEHWIIGEHRAPTAARKGGAHYRALHRLNSTIRVTHCAGLTASILKRCGYYANDEDRQNGKLTPGYGCPGSQTPPTTGPR